MPVIFITAHGEPRMRAQAMQAGALAFLDKQSDDVLRQNWFATALSVS